jgi:hypothetical protein
MGSGRRPRLSVTAELRSARTGYVRPPDLRGIYLHIGRTITYSEPLHLCELSEMPGVRAPAAVRSGCDCPRGTGILAGVSRAR